MNSIDDDRFSVGFFEIDPDDYARMRDLVLGPRIGPSEASHSILACRIDVVPCISGDRDAITYVTNGVGAFPVRDDDYDGYVSREIAFSAKRTFPQSQAITLLENIVDGLLDRHATPSDGACFDWPDVFESTDLRDCFTTLYFGRLVIPEDLRRLKLPGVPETIVLEAVPLKDREVAELQGSEESVKRYFQRTGIDPTSMDR